MAQGRRYGGRGPMGHVPPVGEEVHAGRGISSIFVEDRVTDYDKKLTSFQCLNPDAVSYELINVR